jgi:signal transduction histidine kinase/ActR/RegA family two-component response regulator
LAQKAANMTVVDGAAKAEGSVTEALPSLDAQAHLAPYALGLFGIALPIFGWALSYAADRLWSLASLAIFAINWGALYIAIDWLRRHPERRADPGLRTRLQVIGGLLWAVAVAQVAVIGDHAGLAREDILWLATGAAVVCVFFSAPSMPSLLIVGPTAAAAPMAFLFINPDSRAEGRIAWAAISLALALSLILNRLLRRQFMLDAERGRLIQERAQSLASAETLARSKADLLATLGDEIRNGLTGAAHVLAAAAGQGGRTAPSREQLTAALGAAEDLLRVLDATLDIEAAEAGRLAVQPQPLDLQRLARDVIEAARPQAAAKGLALTMHAEDALEGGAAIADPGRTRQILVNLVGNAVRYTVRGRIEVRLSGGGDKTVRVEVVDSGPGLSPEELEQAFQPFQRIERTAAGIPGAGVGLSLSRRLAEMMGGRLTADSTVGIGCAFRLELPFDASAGVDEAPLARSRTVAVKAQRILLAGDQALHAAMLRATLEQLGHQVIHAHDGRRARELAKTCDIDLVVLDVAPPVLDGPRTIRSIRRLDAPAAEAPIIAIIGGDADEAAACRTAGADQVLRKPVTVAGMARAIAAMLREERGAPPIRLSA